MDKKTNAFNISIAAVNFFNALLLLFFTEIFNLPPLAIGVMGVLFFVINCIFAIVILIMVMYTSIRALISKNPDTRYQPMRDDRGSFIKSQTNLGTTELDALGATACGDGKHTAYNAERKRMDLDDDEASSFDGVNSGPQSTTQVNVNHNGAAGDYYNNMPKSPVEQPSAPMLRGASPNGEFGAPPYRPGSQRSLASPSPVGAAPGAQGYRERNNASPSPWQRGVGY